MNRIASSFSDARLRRKKRGVARNARQSRRGFWAASLQPINLRPRSADLERERRDLAAVLDYVAQTRSPMSATAPRRSSYAGYFAELIRMSGRRRPIPTSRCSGSGASMVEAMAAGVPIYSAGEVFEDWLMRGPGRVPAGPIGSSADARRFCGAARYRTAARSDS